MKTLWQFYFQYEDLQFERSYTYVVPVSAEHAKAFGLPETAFEATLMIEPTDKVHNRTRWGKINIFLTGDQHDTRDLAHSLAFNLAEHITFSQAPIRIDGSFVSNELLPETPEEMARVGESRFSWTMRVREVQEPLQFNSSLLQNVTNNPLIRQFNEANDAKSSVDRFIGLFKILEDLFGGHPLKAALKNSTELKRIAFENLRVNETNDTRRLSNDDFERLIDSLVNTRHQCAHLRRSEGFGIAYGDARVSDDIEPLLDSLAMLASLAIENELKRLTSVEST
jgi:hypothetical protein